MPAEGYDMGVTPHERLARHTIRPADQARSCAERIRLDDHCRPDVWASRPDRSARMYWISDECWAQSHREKPSTALGQMWP